MENATQEQRDINLKLWKKVQDIPKELIKEIEVEDGNEICSCGQRFSYRNTLKYCENSACKI